MKVTPVAGTGVPGQSLSTGPDVSRIERAKAIFAGVELTPQEQPEELEKPNVKTIKMKTQVSTNRDTGLSQEPQVVTDNIETKPLESPTVDTNEQVNGTDETKPIDPSVAQLMKVKRALQVKERELAQERADFEAKKSENNFNPADYISKSDLKANALKVLQQEDVLGPKTYDLLTEQILANQSGVTPELLELKAEIKSLKEEMTGQLDNRDKQAEQQVLAEMKREALQLTADGEQYEAIRAAKAQKDIVGLVHRVWQNGWPEKGYEAGHVMDMAEAADIVENQLLEEALPFAKLKKVQSRLTPAQVEQVEKAIATPKPNTKVMRTLTNRDTAMQTMDRRARAIAAMQGTLKKGQFMAISPVYANSSNQIAALKELYVDDKDYMKNIVYSKNPWLAMVPKNESPDGFAGKYIPVPLEYGNPQGRAHVFANAQNQQTASDVISYFVFAVQDYQLVTITNLLMEQTKSNAGAFVDEASRTMDNGFRNLSNNMAFELFYGGTATRGSISGAPSYSAPNLTIQLSNPQNVVQFEVGMTLQASATDGGSALQDTPGTIDAIQLISVNRNTGVIVGTVVQGAPQTSWVDGSFLQVLGDIGIGGSTTIAGMLGLSGLAAWVPFVDPPSTDNFWGVNRSADPTRLGGLRYDASAQSIAEGITNALALANREGASPDLIILDFQSYASLVNELGAKVQYVQLEHDEVEVAFEAIHFHSAYGKIPVLADRSAQAQNAWVLTVDTWKLRTLGKAPHVLTYGMEGLEGLRVGNADALEIRIAYYGNVINSAPGYNMNVQLSA